MRQSPKNKEIDVCLPDTMIPRTWTYPGARIQGSSCDHCLRGTVRQDRCPHKTRPTRNHANTQLWFCWNSKRVPWGQKKFVYNKNTNFSQEALILIREQIINMPLADVSRENKPRFYKRKSPRPTGQTDLPIFQ